MGTRSPRILIQFAVVFGAVLVAQASQAWQASKVSSGCPRRWWSSKIPITLNNVGLQGVSNADFKAVLDQAIGRWQQSACAKPLPWQMTNAGWGQTSVLGPGCKNAACSAIEPNGNFVWAWQTDWPFGASVVSNTVVTANTCTGEIVDADIAIDDTSRDYCVGNCTPGELDLCTVLTHELGHLLGLDHSQDPEATMYATAPAGETKKCSLTADDEAGVCALYDHTCDCTTAKGADAGSSGADAGSSGPAPATAGGCQGARRSSQSGMGLLASAAVAWWWARRRRSSACNDDLGSARWVCSVSCSCPAWPRPARAWTSCGASPTRCSSARWCRPSSPVG
jgi:hypothetical protein